MRQHSLCLAVVSVLGLVACAAPAEDSRGSSSEVTINPEGGQPGGKLMVVAPSPLGSATVMANRTVSPGQSAGNSFELVPGQAKLVPVGTYCIWTRVDGIDTIPNCNEQVTSGGAITHVLGSLK